MSAWSYSRHLQRLMIDFGAEGSFERSSKRLKLHHHVSVSSSIIRKITLQHGKLIQQQQKLEGGHGRLKSQGAACIITELDGSMVPIVACSAGKGSSDSRKHRDCYWKEARLCAAQVQGESSTHYGVSFGSVEQAGFTWSATVAKLGWSIHTDLHVVGDGAPWIAQQSSECLGAGYLVDFYHVCDYLAAASTTAATHPRWLEVQKKRLKNNRADKVIKALKPYSEEAYCPDRDAPVRVAIRYLRNRIDQLDYHSAIEKDLPIGSGMIESAHRHILQDRLKLAGAWWTQENAEAMAALRVARANEEESYYWKKAA